MRCSPMHTSVMSPTPPTAPSELGLAAKDQLNEPVCIGAMLGLYWGYMGIMEKKMETSIIGYNVGFRGKLLP